MTDYRRGRQSFLLPQPVAITAWASVAGKKEVEGPLSHTFDVKCRDTYFGQKTWEQAEKQMQQLRAQVRPHFLYNTLESIYCLAQNSGDKRIAVMTSSLGKLLRASLNDKRDIVTVREDLHDPSPRQHMRYLEPLFMPLLLVTLNTLDEQLSAARRRVLAVLTAVWGVGFIAFCRAIGAGAGDNTLLQWFDFVADRLDRLPVLGLNGWLLVWRCIIVFGAAVIGALLLRRKARRAMAGAVLALCVLCYAGEWRINRWTYGIDAETMQAASDLNDSLHELDGTVLFIPYGIRQRNSQLIETYVDRDFYIAEYETLVQTGLLDDGVLDLTTEAPAPEYPGHAYTDLAEADWLLVSDDVPLDTTNLTPSGIACPAGYTLWQNHAPTQVQF